MTGTVRWQIDELEPWLDPIVSNGADPPLTTTGLLTFTRTSSNARPAGTLRGLDLGGTPMWELELPLLVDLRIVHDALLTFELDTSAARVRVSRWG